MVIHIHIQEDKVIGQSIRKVEWKVITSRANVVGKNAPKETPFFLREISPNPCRRGDPSDTTLLWLLSVSLVRPGNFTSVI